MEKESNVRTQVKEIQNGIKNAKNGSGFLKKLKVLHQAFPVISGCSATTEQQTEECDIFMHSHYSKMAVFLLECISLETVGKLQKNDFTDYFLSFFLQGCAEDSFLALTHTLWKTEPGYKLYKCVTILEEFSKNHKFADILSEQSALNKGKDTSMRSWREDGRLLLWDSLITEMTSLPEKMANKLKSEVSEQFLPKQYIRDLCADITTTMTRAVYCVGMSQDCSLEFVSRLVGKLCICGYGESVCGTMLRQLSGQVRRDYIWSSVVQRVVIGVPDRCMESVLVPLIKCLPWYGLLEKYLGNCVTQKPKVQLLLCTKFIFHRYYKSVLVLQNVIGYLASATPRQHLYIKLLHEIIQVWGDQSCLNHTPCEQHLYITQALIICIAFLNEQHRQEHRDEILRLLLPGVEAHIGSSEQKIRLLGMHTAELVTSVIDPDGPKFDFEYKDSKEFRALKELLKIPQDPHLDEVQDELERLLSGETMLGAMSDLKLNSNSDEAPPTQNKQVNNPVAQSDLDSDDDDDLEPYDMSDDKKVEKVKQPMYIRDCMEGLINADKPDNLDACLSVAEKLIRANPDGLREISAEFSKVLLHLTEGFALPSFRAQRFNALVALAVICPKEVAGYLTEQFYERNYSIRQRLDIIEVIGASAQELSKPSGSSSSAQEKTTRKVEDTIDPGCEPQTWQEVVQKRIESNTRRFGQGRSKSVPEPVENKFSPVAGYFFYPLMKNFDRPDNTFDLMGADCMVLSRLMYTLGIVIYAARNTPPIRQMATCLLEFLWMLRYHSDTSVRQGLLFALSMVYLSVPPFMLLEDLQQEVFESKNWLEDVLDSDVDGLCKTLAVQALVLLENIIKQEFLLDADKT